MQTCSQSTLGILTDVVRLHAQDDCERQELRVEMALAELSCHRHQDQRKAAAADAAAGIDAFEMTLKRLGATGGSGVAGGPSHQLGTLCPAAVYSLAHLKLLHSQCLGEYSSCCCSWFV